MKEKNNMSSIKDLNEKLLWEVKDDEEKKEKKAEKKDDDKKDDDNGDKKSKTLRSREFRDTLQNYKGRISGSADVDVDYKELRKKLEDSISGVNWTIPNVKKAFGIITKMIGVQPEDKE